ncbi:MAG: glycosyltransferase [Nitrospirae bacterium]|nr:glycosyltransferase [Nitrospirota bacterium]
MTEPESRPKPRILWIGGRGGEGAPLLMGLEAHFDLRYAEEFLRAGQDRLRLPELLRRVAESGLDPDLYYFWNPSLAGDYEGWEALPSRSIGHFIDSHYAFTWQAELAPLFHTTVLEVHSAAPYFWRNNPNSILWCPPCFHGTAEEVRHHPPYSRRPIDVAFIGSMNPLAMPHRVDFMQRLAERLKNRYRVLLGRHEGPVGSIYSQAKIVINFTTRPAWAYVPDPLHPQPHAVGLNGRVFDAMGHGAMHLADSPASDLLQLFREGEHFAFYRCNDVEDALDQIRYFLEHDEQRLSIALAGWQSIQERHTLPVRGLQLASLVTRAMDPSAEPPLHPRDARFLLGRSLLNMALQTADARDGSLKRNFDEKLSQARGLFAAECSPTHEPVRRSMLPLLDAIEGRPENAVRQWFGLWKLYHCPVAALFLEVALWWLGQDGQANNMADWQAKAAKEGAGLPPQERRTLSDILCLVFQKFPRGMVEGGSLTRDIRQRNSQPEAVLSPAI